MKLNIRKSSGIALALAAGLSGSALTGVANAQDAPRLVLNNRPLRTHVEPVIQDGRVLIPLRDIFEGLGANVRYDRRDRTITARRHGTVVRMEVGSRRAEVDGRRVLLDVPADTVDGSTMVPLRFVSEALGATVNYNANRNVVRITDGDTFVDRDRRDDDRNGRWDDRRGDGRRNDHR